MDKSKIDSNLEFVRSNFQKLLESYLNKYILVHDGAVIGSYDTYEAAAEEGVRAYGIDNDFLVEYISESQPVNYVALAEI